MSKNITKYNSEEIQLPQHYPLSPPQCSWDKPSAEWHWKPLSGFGIMAMPHSGCTFDPRSRRSSASPKANTPCFHIRGSVNCKGWAHDTLLKERPDNSKHFFVFCQMLTLMGERDCHWPNINIENTKSEKKTLHAVAFNWTDIWEGFLLRKGGALFAIAWV